MRVPRPERLPHGQRGVDEERLGGRASRVEEVECRVAHPEEGVWLEAEEVERVEYVADYFGEGPGEDHACVEWVRVGLSCAFVSCSRDVYEVGGVCGTEITKIAMWRANERTKQGRGQRV